VSDPDHVFEIGEEAELLGLLRLLQRAVLEHPVAAQAAFSALVAEGRAFAQTEEGAEWQRRLAGSSLVEKGRVIWQVTTLDVLEDSESTVVPSRVLDAFVKLTHERTLEMILGRLYDETDAGGSDAAAP
jgi:hypothetical protein